MAGATSGQALIFNGTQVVWSQVNALNAVNAANATNADHLNGFDWTALFDNGNPQSGAMSVAYVSSRGGANIAGDLLASGRAFLSGPTIVSGPLFAPNIALNMSLNDWGIYLRAVGDFNHFLKWADVHGSQTGFDGPVLAGLGGGVLGSTDDWTLRWNRNGSVQTRGTIFSGSDRNVKENFQAIDAEEVLAKVAAMPITRWAYKADPSAEHIGPVAQDFRAAFGLGSDDKSIAMVDGDGVALAAIQGLNRKVDQEKNGLWRMVKQQQGQIEALQAALAGLNARTK